MTIHIEHPDLSKNEKTYLTSACAAAATTLTVQNIEGFAVGNYLVLGKLGEEKTEIVRIHTSTAPTSSTITLNAACSFAHSVNTPVTYIAFNQVAVYSALSKTSAYSAVSGSPVSIEVDQDYTEFSDSAGTTSTWYKVRYYNSSTSVYSSYSDVVQGSGYSDDSLRRIIDKASVLANDKNHKIYSEDEKIEIVNDGYQETINRLEKSDHKRFLKKGYVDILNSYDTGTVAITDGGTIVTGTSTSWSSATIGNKIIFEDEGFPYEIASIDSTTQVTLTRAYNGGGTNLTTATYLIFKDEYVIYNEATGAAVVDFKKIEQVVDEDSNIVSEFDLHRNEDGYFIKREDDNLRLCINYHPSTSDAEGRWTVWYRYQPPKLDSMADEPELPQGYSGLLVSYLVSKIQERASEMDKAGYSMREFINNTDKMIGQSTPRTNEKKSFRIDRNLAQGDEHDDDFGDENLWGRKTIGT